MKKTLIIANGYKPKKFLIEKLIKSGYGNIICTDGAANNLKIIDIIPNIILGDLDSLENSTLRFYKNKSKIIKVYRQSDTDLEKVLKYCIKQGIDDIIILSAIGSRLDHSINNLSLVLKYSDKIKIKLVHDFSLLEVVSGNADLNLTIGEIVSFYSFDIKTKITTRGLKYNLKSSNLLFGYNDSTSNRVVDKTVKIKIINGKTFMVRELKYLFKND